MWVATLRFCQAGLCWAMASAVVWARDKSLLYDGVNVFFGQRPGDALGLPLAPGVETDIGMALQTHVDIPGGFAVANGNDAGRLHALKRLRP